MNNDVNLRHEDGYAFIGDDDTTGDNGLFSGGVVKLPSASEDSHRQDFR